MKDKSWKIFFYDENGDMADVSDDYANYRVCLDDAKAAVDEKTCHRAEVIEETKLVSVEREYKVVVHAIK